MNGLSRIIAALKREIPDRVPHLELAYNEGPILNIARHFTDDLPSLDYFQRMNPEDKIRLFEALLLVIERLDVDGLTLRLFSDVTFIDDLRYVDEWGVTYKLDPNGEALVVKGVIEKMEDLDSYRTPEPKETDLLALSYCNARFKGERALVMSLRCPFRLSWNLVGGMNKLLVLYRRNPEMVHRMARIATDYIFKEIDLSAKLGADVFSLDGDLAFDSGTFMSPDQFREFLLPYYREIIDYIHSKDLLVFKHSDGNVWGIIYDWIDAGFEGIHPFQPQCMDLAESKEKLGDTVCLMGNIDCIDTLVSGSEQDVEEEVRQAIKTAGPGGGYILSSSNTIHPGVKAENYIAMVKATHKYGVYDGAIPRTE
ncbi:MAG: hypothetical protein JW885_15820 [Deltaproteobacteria bacterium]|nr:hypothetical protein [Candidatus Zymogenaceae bacterium]